MSKRPLRQGFTLVELLVVIAIIAMLVTLLLPAVQAAREAARRTQCINKLKQIGLAILNHESTLAKFPGGGDTPWPSLEHNVVGGAQLGPEKHGFSWAFQVLPYLEEGAVLGLDTTAKIAQTVIPLYNCPSRREIKPSTATTFGGAGSNVMMDYASATPRGGRSVQGDFREYAHNDENSFWQGSIWTVPNGKKYYGIIVRANAWPPETKESVNGSSPTTAGKVTDGLSKTMLVAEKRHTVDRYSGLPTPAWHDDRGWSDGWDPDTVRSTGFDMGQDLATEQDAPKGIRNYGFQFGSAHSEGIHSVFGDGAVHRISYSIDPEVFNNMGDRRDGNPVAFD